MFRRKRATGVTQKLPNTVWKRTVASRGRIDAVVTVIPASVIVSIDTFTLTAWRQKGSGDSQMRTCCCSLSITGCHPDDISPHEGAHQYHHEPLIARVDKYPTAGHAPKRHGQISSTSGMGHHCFGVFAGLSSSPTSDLMATDRCFDDDLEATVACHRSTSNPEGLYAASRALWQTRNCLRWKSSRETTTTIIATTIQAADEEDDKDNLG